MLETLLLLVFLSLDVLLYYIFFESTLPPLFILIGLFGASDRVRAGFYLFLYTLLGSLFLLLAVLSMYSIMGNTDFNVLYKMIFKYHTQIYLFCGMFIAFAVKTPTILLNTWLLKAHVESPLSGSIILAAIVLKLSLFGIFRLILPLVPKAYTHYTLGVYVIGVITIIYASISTLRTIDVKELIAYSSVSHAAVYLMGAFSNTIQGIEGGIALGLAHGFVSSGLFISVGGVLYDRCSSRLITFYRGIAQIMPIFSLIFFILCLGNCGVPLTLNFIGEFLCLYGAIERLPFMGALASSSIIFSAAYTIYMFNRIVFAGSYSKFFEINIPDLNRREFYILLVLVVFTVIFGIYPSFILDGLHYSATSLIYYDSSILLENINEVSILHSGINFNITDTFTYVKLAYGLYYVIIIAMIFIFAIILYRTITKLRSTNYSFVKQYILNVTVKIFLSLLMFICITSHGNFLLLELSKSEHLPYATYVFILFRGLCSLITCIFIASYFIKIPGKLQLACCFMLSTLISSLVVVIYNKTDLLVGQIPLIFTLFFTGNTYWVFPADSYMGPANTSTGGSNNPYQPSQIETPVSQAINPSNTGTGTGNGTGTVAETSTSVNTNSDKKGKSYGEDTSKSKDNYKLPFILNSIEDEKQVKGSTTDNTLNKRKSDSISTEGVGYSNANESMSSENKDKSARTANDPLNFIDENSLVDINTNSTGAFTYTHNQKSEMYS